MFENQDLIECGGWNGQEDLDDEWGWIHGNVGRRDGEGGRYGAECTQRLPESVGVGDFQVELASTAQTGEVSGCGVQSGGESEQTHPLIDSGTTGTPPGYWPIAVWVPSSG